MGSQQVDSSKNEAQKRRSHTKRILLVGVSSYLGSALAMGLRDEFEIIGTYFENPLRIEGVHCTRLDAMNANMVYETVKRFQPDTCIYCPGVQDIDKVQVDIEDADNLHAKGPALFFKIPVSNFHFIYFSTDQVFGNSVNDTQRPPFKESDTPHPVNHYGQTKLQGESLVKSQARFTHILRLGEVYGEPFGFGDSAQKRKSWIETVRKRLERGERISVSKDEVRTPLYVGDFVRAMDVYLKDIHPEVSLHHLAGSQSISRFDFVKLLCEKLGLDASLVSSVSMEQDRSIKTARPRNCSLSSAKFEADYKFVAQSAEHGIGEMAERLRVGFTKAWP